MFRRSAPQAPRPSPPIERVTSVLGPGINWHGSLRGSGGIRIEGNFEGEIAVRGLLVVGETGRITCDTLKANVVVVAGSVNGKIVAEKLEIRSTGRVWGDVTTVAFATEEGSFLRGHVTMEEQIDLAIEEAAPVEEAAVSPEALPLPMAEIPAGDLPVETPGRAEPGPEENGENKPDGNSAGPQGQDLGGSEGESTPTAPAMDA